jgi:hypothetical protein
MSSAQSFVASVRPARTSVRGSIFLAILFLLSVSHPPVYAQSGVPLIPVATDVSVSGSLSNQFGVPAGQAINQAGDLVFIGRGNTALFFRVAGAGSSTRLLQTGDEVPGFPNSHVTSFSTQVSINRTANIVFAVTYSLPDALPHQALLIYDGTGYHKVVSSDDTIPGGTGTYGTAVTPLRTGAINDNGDVAFTTISNGSLLNTL